MKVKSESEVTQSCSTVRDPIDCGPPGSSVHGIFQARMLEWGATAFSDQGSNLRALHWERSFNHWTTREVFFLRDREKYNYIPVPFHAVQMVYRNVESAPT